MGRCRGRRGKLIGVNRGTVLEAKGKLEKDNQGGGEKIEAAGSVHKSITFLNGMFLWDWI